LGNRDQLCVYMLLHCNFSLTYFEVKTGSGYPRNCNRGYPVPKTSNAAHHYSPNTVVSTNGDLLTLRRCRLLEDAELCEQSRRSEKFQFFDRRDYGCSKFQL